MGITENLTQLANQAMIEKGLQPEFSKEALQQLSQIKTTASFPENATDLRSLLWCSIDNDDSRDLDQLTYAEKGSDGKMTLWVAIADVDALVPKDSPIDHHAKINTTSVYTPTKIFPMLPEKLSTDLTSLNEKEERLAIVIKILLNASGEIENSLISQAIVYNFAKLTYSTIGGWLEGKLPLPEKVKRVAGLEKTLLVQHEIAQFLKQKRHEAGSLTLESSDAEVKVESDREILIQLPTHNFAHQLIEEFMIAGNHVMALHFKTASIPSLRRVVRVPKNWERIVDVAREYGETLPRLPDSKALDAFLLKRQKADPISFPDLSLTVIKLLGRGEYIVENDKERPVGHFALAIKDYTHSTAPNRRFPDLITQRQMKAFAAGKNSPYSLQELRELALHCSQQEDAAVHVERQMNKSAAASLLSTKIGATFKGIVTGVNDKGTWVRLLDPSVEGKIVQGFEKLKVGDKVSVKLKHVDIARGFIDFIF